MERGDIYLNVLLKDYEQRYVQELRELKKMPEGISGTTIRRNK